jgi:hypothetical protein
MSIEEYDDKLSNIKMFYNFLGNIIKKGYNNNIEYLTKIVKDIIHLDISDYESNEESDNESYNESYNESNDDSNDESYNESYNESNAESDTEIDNASNDETDNESNDELNYEEYEELKTQLKIQTILNNKQYPKNYLDNNGEKLINRMNNFIQNSYYY